jgi:hypothetical protein
MPQYGVLVYAPPSAEPLSLPPDYIEQLDRYPELAKELGGKVLGGSYFPSHKGFAFEASTTAVAVQGDIERSGPLVESKLVPSAFYVLSAPDIDVAVRVAKVHPAVRDGGVEVRPLFSPSE